MLGWFKKKEKPKRGGRTSSLSSEAQAAARKSSQLIYMSLVLCSENNHFLEKLHTEFIRGYLCGFFDGALQANRIQLDDESFCFYITVSHGYLFQNFEGLVPDYFSFSGESIDLLGSKVFSVGQQIGGTEYMKDKIPSTLMQFFMT